MGALRIQEIESAQGDSHGVLTIRDHANAIESKRSDSGHCGRIDAVLQGPLGGPYGKLL